MATLADHTEWVTSVAFHPAAPLLATGGDDSLELWWLSDISDPKSMAMKRVTILKKLNTYTIPRLSSAYQTDIQDNLVVVLRPIVKYTPREMCVRTVKPPTTVRYPYPSKYSILH